MHHVETPGIGAKKHESVCKRTYIDPFSRFPFSLLRLNLVLARGVLPDFRGGAPFFIQTAIRHWVSADFIGSRNCVPMTFTAESPPAQGQ